MGLRIYKIIDNRTAEKKDLDIILEFVCEVNLYDDDEIFNCCLSYDSESEGYNSVSEVYYSVLNYALDNLRRRINRCMSQPLTPRIDSYLSEANRCCRILSEALEGMTRGFFMIFR